MGSQRVQHDWVTEQQQQQQMIWINISQTGPANGQEAHEKMPNNANYQGNANGNYNESGRSLVVQWLRLVFFICVAWVQPLVRELRSHKLYCMAKKTHNEISPHLLEWLSSESAQITNVGKVVEEREPSYTVGGNVNWCGPCGNQLEVSQNTKNYNYRMTQFIFHS